MRNGQGPKRLVVCDKNHTSVFPLDTEASRQQWTVHFADFVRLQHIFRRLKLIQKLNFNPIMGQSRSRIAPTFKEHTIPVLQSTFTFKFQAHSDIT